MRVCYDVRRFVEEYIKDAPERLFLHGSLYLPVRFRCAGELRGEDTISDILRYFLFSLEVEEKNMRKLMVENSEEGTCSAGKQGIKADDFAGGVDPDVTAVGICNRIVIRFVHDLTIDARSAND